jgi:CheY-like chemotaxis protein
MTKRILVIDDDASVRDAFALALLSSGYVVECSEDGLSGIETAGKNRPDLVFLDLKMPGIDGVETLRRLRAQDKNPPPVYIVTAFAREFMEPLQQVRAENIPFQLASKPLTSDQILQIAKAVLGDPS